MAGIYKVAIFDSRIAGMFGPVGTDASAFTRKNVGHIRSLAVATSPKRSGTLAASHKTTGPYKVGAYGLQGQVYNDARHAEWVHEGTYGPITPKRTRRANGAPAMLRLPWSRANNRWQGPWRKKPFVDGQDAQPWLAEAGRFIASRYI